MQLFVVRSLLLQLVVCLGIEPSARCKFSLLRRTRTDTSYRPRSHGSRLGLPSLTRSSSVHSVEPKRPKAGGEQVHLLRAKYLPGGSEDQQTSDESIFSRKTPHGQQRETDGSFPERPEAATSSSPPPFCLSQQSRMPPGAQLRPPSSIPKPDSAIDSLIDRETGDLGASADFADRG